MPIIITIMIAMFLILISWTWHNLGDIEKIKKIITMIVLFVLIYIVTLIVFNISKSDILYNSKEAMENVKTILVLLFTMVNGLIIMPFIAKILNKISCNDSDYKDAKKSFLVIFILFIIVIIFECGYLKDIQNGILNVYNKATLK